MNIILTGFMACGKTDIGRALARFLKMKMFDTDEMIQIRENMNISEIFEKKGEEYFRDLESQLAEELGGSDNCVVSTGGGFVLRPENIQKIRKHGWVVHLQCSIDKILERVEGRTDRPLLNVPDKRERIEALLQHRQPFYDNCDISYDTTNTDPARAAEEIIERLGLWKKYK